MDDLSARFEMRANKQWLDRVDGWRRQQSDIPPRAAAIRRLVELGLKAKSSGEAWPQEDE